MFLKLNSVKVHWSQGPALLHSRLQASSWRKPITSNQAPDYKLHFSVLKHRACQLFPTWALEEVGHTTLSVWMTSRSWGCYKFMLNYWKPVLKCLQPKWLEPRVTVEWKLVEKMSSLKQIQTSSFRRKSMLELMWVLCSNKTATMFKSLISVYKRTRWQMQVCNLTFQDTFFLSNCFNVSLLNKEWTGSNKSGIIYFPLHWIGTNE